MTWFMHLKIILKDLKNKKNFQNVFYFCPVEFQNNQWSRSVEKRSRGRKLLMRVGRFEKPGLELLLHRQLDHPLVRDHHGHLEKTRTTVEAWFDKGMVYLKVFAVFTNFYMFSKYV